MISGIPRSCFLFLLSYSYFFEIFYFELGFVVCTSGDAFLSNYKAVRSNPSVPDK